VADSGRAVDSIVRSAQGAGVDVEVVVAWQGPEPPPASSNARIVDVFPVGLSYARNRGFRETRSALVAFVDDDEVVAPGWIGAVLSAFDEPTPAAGAFGPVSPLGGAALSHPRDSERRVFSGRRTGPWFVGTGGNMAFRREVFAASGGFDLRFGAGAAARAAEDWDLIVRLLREGHALVWSSQMLVYHPAKDDHAQLASRFPYGFGVGHLARRHRDVLLALRYSRAISEVLIEAVGKRDRRRLREGLAILRGFVAGAASRARPLSPEAALARLPEALRERVGAERWRPLELVRSGEPELRYRGSGGRVLHVYVSPPPGLEASVAGRPETEALSKGRDSLWVISRGT